jgi:hypothetical protein
VSDLTTAGLPVPADADSFGASMCANWQNGLSLKTTNQGLVLQQAYAALTPSQVVQWNHITNTDLCPAVIPPQ